MEHIEGLVCEVTPLLKMGPTIDSGVLISVGVKLAVRVNALNGLSGVQKRDLVMVVLSRALENLKAEEVKKAGAESSQAESIAARYEKLQASAREVVPAAIDVAIDAARGKLNLRKIKPSALVKYCSCFAATAVSALSAAGVISAEESKKADLVVRKVENVSLQVVEKAVAVAEAEKGETPAPAPAASEEKA